MGNYNEFDLDLSQGETSNDVSTNFSSNICWAVSTYVTSSIANGNCKTVTNDACTCDGGVSVSGPCGSGGYRVK